ncbi:MAG: alpha/beta hydrolase, partial [Oscillospiraceae bacterium]|nr:alpha/beta hydrolase [Oscillospiraceae bacterium]
MKTGKIKKAGLIILIVLLLLTAADWIVSVIVYEQCFGVRYDSYEPKMLYLDDFEGLERTRYQFPSDKGQMLTGYLYTSGDDQHGIIIIAHGFGGGGHNSYMDCADYFAKHGYYVFAYDATGCDESEGDKVGSLAQGVADLEYAISFVESSD